MNLIDGLPVYELEMSNESQGVHAISIVENPAHQAEFIAMQAELDGIKMQFADEDKQIITGAALIPNVLIYRAKPQPHYVKFSEETIVQLQEKFSKESRAWEVNFNHDESDTAEVSIIESWIVMDSEKDKSSALGLNLEKGTWVVSMKIDDREKWDRIKNTGLYNGLSIEAMLTRKLVQEPVEQLQMEQEILDLKAKLETMSADNATLKEVVAKFEEEAAKNAEEGTPAETPAEDAPKTYTEEEVAELIKKAIEEIAAKEAAVKAEEDAAKVKEQEEADAAKAKEAEEAAKLAEQEKTIMHSEGNATSDAQKSLFSLMKDIKNK